ncbi:hypothetical protein GCM10008018_17020 [Paenibacillus marchantiophytorum]|uniref:Aspartyl-phosphate phosphatase Spo0E family protein n=1 Tax=Paenibacillus marchantiophytorum TaxID=1619310 RepID=A0ABQ2BUH1_9BACL|nr:hypothetical protein GCM10008018_17020 [Paenibacillus marchantiophytorum]
MRIEQLRAEMNDLNASYEQLLVKSEELDQLILQYMQLKNNKLNLEGLLYD